MQTNIYDKFKLKRVINASGKMTILGVSVVNDGVINAMKTGAQNFFIMKDLIKNTGAYIANLLGVEDSVIVSSASAGIAQSVAAVIGQGNLFHLYHPYDDTLTKREIIVPKGHNVDYGTPVELMIGLGGGKVVEAGYGNMCSKQHIELMINKNTAAIIYIKSHHTVQKEMVDVKDAVEVAHKHNLPLIVDAAAEEDLFRYYSIGADLIIYSGAKAIEGPTSGIVIGKTKYIEWVRLQSNGIGRAMKVGKESIIGLTYAIEEYLKNGTESGESMINRLKPFVDSLNQIKEIKADIVQDAAGRDIYRARLSVNGSMGMSASKLVQGLKNGNPSIYTREYQVNNGIIEFDIRSVTNSDLHLISERIKDLVQN